MATQGRKPKPTALRLVEQGGKLRERHAKRARTEPVARSGLPHPPPHLSPAQLELWRRIESSAPQGLLTEVDGDIIDGYVLLLSARNECARLFNQTNGAILVRGTGGNSPALTTNPLLKELKRLTTELLQLQTHLGFSPVARTRIAVPLHGDDEDPLSRFFGPAA